VLPQPKRAFHRVGWGLFTKTLGAFYLLVKVPEIACCGLKDGCYAREGLLHLLPGRREYGSDLRGLFGADVDAEARRRVQVEGACEVGSPAHGSFAAGVGSDVGWPAVVAAVGGSGGW
jgi:hypothetical protein